MFQTRGSCAYRLDGLHPGLRSSQPQKDAGAGVVDRKISKLHELREKELAYKDNYTIFDEMFMCFRCLFDWPKDLQWGEASAVKLQLVQK